MNARGILSMVLLAGVMGCSSRGCDFVPNLELDFSTTDTCTPAGGTCQDFCTGNTSPHAELSCGTLSDVCCKVGSGGSSGGFGSSGGPIDGSPTTFTEGTCNGEKCGAGCLCRPDLSIPDFCRTACDCSTAGDGGADAGDLDAGEDAEAGVSQPPPRSCGNIMCAGACDCLSQSLSVCECRSSTCPQDAGAE